MRRNGAYSSPKNAMALIPCKGASNRLPAKNKRLLGGKPLVCWTIEAALAADSISRVVVSTEDEGIKALAYSYSGVEVLARPEELARDPAEVPQVIYHAIRAIPGPPEQPIVTLLPSSPFRDARWIDEAPLPDEFIRSVLSMSEVMTDDLTLSDGYLKPPVKHNGAILSASRATLERSMGWVPRWGATPVLMDPYSGLDINTKADWALAERIAAQLNRGAA